MNRISKLIIYCCSVALLLMSCNSKSKTSTPKVVEEKNIIQLFKEQIDTAEMRTYVDKDYNVEVSYPSFFAVCDTTENGTARFYFPNKQKGAVALIMFVEHNVDGWNIHEAVENLSDSLNICREEGKNYYLMTGSVDESSRIFFVEKCFLIDNKWYNYTLFYPAEFGGVMGRLRDTVKNWTPQPSTVKRKK